MPRKYPPGKPEPIALLNRVELRETGEPLVDLRKTAPWLKLLKPTGVPWARKTVSEMLNVAKRKLPKGLRMGLREAWRSLDRQKFVYDSYIRRLRSEHPTWNQATLRRMTNRFYAPYDQKAPPGHSTGGAIDVWLLDEAGEKIELDGQGERFASAPTFAPHLSEQILEGRYVLYRLMTDVGFTNCKDEWWHYSYGDHAWAVRSGRKTCPYGYIEPARREYERADERFFREISRTGRSRARK